MHGKGGGHGRVIAKYARYDPHEATWKLGRFQAHMPIRDMYNQAILLHFRSSPWCQWNENAIFAIEGNGCISILVLSLRSGGISGTSLFEKHDSGARLLEKGSPDGWHLLPYCCGWGRHSPFRWCMSKQDIVFGRLMFVYAMYWPKICIIHNLILSP